MAGTKRPDYVRRRYPSDVADGSLVFAPYGPMLFPAIKWSGNDEGDDDTVHGLAFLCPIENEFNHPLSMSRSHGEWVLTVDAPWQLRAPVHRSAFINEEPTGLNKSGLVFGDVTYLRIPLTLHNTKFRWQLIDIRTGYSTLQLNDNGLIFIEGWDLFIGEQEKPHTSWPAA